MSQCCQGCGGLIVRGHLACVCPECGGPKSPRARRCSVCAGLGARRGIPRALRDREWPVQPDEPDVINSLPPEIWAATCVHCARETYVDLPRGQRLFGASPCGVCGGRRYVEHVEPGPQPLSPRQADLLAQVRQERAA